TRQLPARPRTAEPEHGITAERMADETEPIEIETVAKARIRMQRRDDRDDVVHTIAERRLAPLLRRLESHFRPFEPMCWPVIARRVAMVRREYEVSGGGQRLRQKLRLQRATVEAVREDHHRRRRLHLRLPYLHRTVRELHRDTRRLAYASRCSG